MKTTALTLALVLIGGCISCNYRLSLTTKTTVKREYNVLISKIDKKPKIQK